MEPASDLGARLPRRAWRRLAPGDELWLGDQRLVVGFDATPGEPDLTGADAQR